MEQSLEDIKKIIEKQVKNRNIDAPSGIIYILKEIDMFDCMDILSQYDIGNLSDLRHMETLTPERVKHLRDFMAVLLITVIEHPKITKKGSKDSLALSDVPTPDLSILYSEMMTRLNIDLAAFQKLDNFREESAREVGSNDGGDMPHPTVVDNSKPVRNIPES